MLQAHTRLKRASPSKHKAMEWVVCARSLSLFRKCGAPEMNPFKCACSQKAFSLAFIVAIFIEFKTNFGALISAFAVSASSCGSLTPRRCIQMMGKGVGEALLMRPFLFRPCSEQFGLPPYKSKVDGCPFHSRNLCMHPHATHNTLESN